MAATVALTIEDFETLPQELVKNHELIDGELVPMSGNTGNHNRIRSFLEFSLLPAVEDPRLGMVISEQEFRFGKNAHAPDVAVFLEEKRALYDGNKRVQLFVPDLAIEIVSANDTLQALVTKKTCYMSFGVAEVWIVNPAGREVYVYSLRGNFILANSDELSTPLIPGFRLAIEDMWQRI